MTPQSLSRAFGCGMERLWLVLVLLAVCSSSSCVTQHTLDEKIYRVASASGSNYYRVRIISTATNGKAQFKAGLYPAYAVDIFQGQGGELPTDGLDAESMLRKM